MHAGGARGSWASYAKASLATLFWGLSFVALRVALESWKPIGVVWARNAIGALVLLAILRAMGGPLWPRREDLGRCALLGLILGCHLLIQTFALGMTTAIRAGWIVAFIPAVVALLAALFLRQRLGRLGWVGIAISTVGVLILTSIRPADFLRAGLGDLLMLCSTFTWAAYTLLSVRPMRESGSLRVTAFSMLIAFPPCLLAAAIDGSWHASPTPRAIAALLFLGVFASATAMWAFNAAVSEIGPARGAAFQYLQPFVTLVGSRVLLGEPLTAGVVAGGPIVLAGVWMIQRSKSAQGRMRV